MGEETVTTMILLMTVTMMMTVTMTMMMTLMEMRMKRTMTIASKPEFEETLQHIFVCVRRNRYRGIASGKSDFLFFTRKKGIQVYRLLYVAVTSRFNVSSILVLAYNTYCTEDE